VVPAAPVDLRAEYRTLQADIPRVPVQYTVVVGDRFESRRLLEEKIRELGEEVLVVMGSYSRRCISWLLWGSRAEEVARDCPCPVLVVKAPSQPAIDSHQWAGECYREGEAANLGNTQGADLR
jgi:nucleotide-binding universal stress UspA family protein